MQGTTPDIRLKTFSAIIVAVLLAVLTATAAPAAPFQVFVERTENTSPMQLRREGLNEGFTVAALNEAMTMLPQSLSEERKSLLKEYLAKRSGELVLGYKEYASSANADGLMMTLDVTVNRPLLRQYLQQCGVSVTALAPRPFTLDMQADGLTSDESLTLRNLMTLSGLTPVEDALPKLTLSRTPGGMWKGTLETGKMLWSGVNKELPELWYSLWPHYFSGGDSVLAGSALRVLKVSGWFSPGGVQDFDAVLRGWDGAVQAADLLEMDLQASRIEARWAVNVVNGGLLESRLEEYLPARGLSYTFEDAPGN